MILVPMTDDKLYLLQDYYGNGKTILFLIFIKKNS